MWRPAAVTARPGGARVRPAAPGARPLSLPSPSRRGRRAARPQHGSENLRSAPRREQRSGGSTRRLELGKRGRGSRGGEVRGRPRQRSPGLCSRAGRRLGPPTPSNPLGRSPRRRSSDKGPHPVRPALNNPAAGPHTSSPLAAGPRDASVSPVPRQRPGPARVSAAPARAPSRSPAGRHRAGVRRPAPPRPDDGRAQDAVFLLLCQQREEGTDTKNFHAPRVEKKH